MNKLSFYSSCFPLILSMMFSFVLLSPLAVADEQLDSLTAAAETGDAESQFELGRRLRVGEGVGADPKAAVEWLRKAADQDHPEAAWALGQMHLAGEGVFKDDVWAINWFRRAALLGHQPARDELNAIYETNGLPVPDWDAMAQAPASEKSEVQPQVPESWEPMETDGEAVVGDEAAALAKAREHGIDIDYTPEAQVEEVLDNAPAMEPAEELTRTVEKEQSELADSLPDPAVSTGDQADIGEVSDAMEALPEPDELAPVETLEPAQTLEPESEQLTQGQMASEAQLLPESETLTAQGTPAVEQDPELAALIERADEGSIAAQLELGTRYQLGNGGAPRDQVQAAQWFTRAAEQGNANAQFNVGNMYLLGEGVSPSDEEALKWYELAAEQGHEAAAGNLANLRKSMGSSVVAVPAAVEEAESVVEAQGQEMEPAFAENIEQLETQGELAPQAPVNVQDVAVQGEVIAEQIPAHEAEPELYAETDSSPEPEQVIASEVENTVPAVSVSYADAENAYAAGNYAAALASYRSFAEAGDAEAQYRLARMYQQGKGTKADEGWAITWYRAAAASGHVQADDALNAIYLDAGIERPRAVAPASSPVTVAQLESAGETIAAQEQPALADLPESLPAAATETETETMLSAVDEQSGSIRDDWEHSGEALEPGETYAAAETDAGDGSASPWSAEFEKTLPEADAAPKTTYEHEVIDGDTLYVGVDNTAGEVVENTSSESGASAELAGAAAQSAVEPGAEPTGGVRGFFRRLLGRENASTQVAAAGAGASAAALAATEETAESAVELAATSADEDSAAQVYADPLPQESDPEPLSETEVQVAEDDFSEPEPLAEADFEAAEEEVAQAPVADIESAREALAAGDFEVAADRFLSLAETGNPEAQAHIGYMYYVGEGVRRDPVEALHWYRQAAGQGNADAQYNLAVAYAFGEGVEQDDAEAANWYRQAADQGHVLSQYSLAISYALGEGVAQSDSEAAALYAKAAEAGYPAAQHNLAYLYRAGKGVEQDNEAALRWYQAAAEQGYAAAQYNLGYMFRSGKGVQRDLDAAQRWYSLAAKQGYGDAAAELQALQAINR